MGPSRGAHQRGSDGATDGNAPKVAIWYRGGDRQSDFTYEAGPIRASHSKKLAQQI